MSFELQFRGDSAKDSCLPQAASDSPVLAVVVAVRAADSVGVPERGGRRVVESVGPLETRLIGSVYGHPTHPPDGVVAATRLPQDFLHWLLRLGLRRVMFGQRVDAEQGQGTAQGGLPAPPRRLGVLRLRRVLHVDGRQIRVGIVAPPVAAGQAEGHGPPRLLARGQGRRA